MSWTNSEVIKEALSEIGLGARSYSQQPEDMMTGLRRMNLMLSEWLEDGIDVGYEPVDDPDENNLSTASGIRTNAIRAVVLNLAVEMSPNFGRTVSTRTLVGAVNAKKLARRKDLVVPQKATAITAVPAGAGHKYRDRIVLTDDTSD